MEIKLYPQKKNFFKEKDVENLNKIIIFAKNLLKKNKVSIPDKIYFYNSFEKFIDKVLPEIQNYGFEKEVSKEIIKCALNNGTYGTVNFFEDSIIEMNFNPFNKGFYHSPQFLELLIHESLHLNLYKKLGEDINSLKFKFDKEKFIGDEKIIQIDEGYAEFMTNRILNKFDMDKIKKIVIPPASKEKPSYKKEVNDFYIEKFDKIFENLFISNREKGLEIFDKKFNESSSNEEILEFAVDELKNII